MAEIDRNKGIGLSSTDYVADFVATTKLEDVPSEAIDIGKNALIDFMGITVLGSKAPAGKILCEYIKDVGAKAESTVICQGIKTSAELAALVNAVMSHADDYGDTLPISAKYNLHPSGAILSALLALAEKKRLSGKELLGAYAIGMEVMYRIGQVIGSRISQAGWHPTPILGTIGAVSASARALKLSSHQVKMALGISGSLAGGISRNNRTMVKGMHVGNAARNGVISATIAEYGFIGSDNVFEGKNGFCQVFSGQTEGLVNAVKDLGSRWQLLKTGLGFKPYPACRSMHASIDGSLYLKEKFNVDVTKISTITIKTSPFTKRLDHDRPRNGYEAKFSPEFCIAIALLFGRVSLEHFTDEWIKDPRVQQLMSNTTMTHPDGWVESLVEHKTEIIVRLENGEEHSHLVILPKGEPENPVTVEVLTNKFMDNCSSILGEEKGIKIVDLTKKLDEMNDLDELFRLLK